MSRDTVRDAFELLGRPVEPPAGLTEPLFARLVEEAERALAGAAPPPAPKTRLRLPRGRYLALTGAGAVLVAVLAVVATTELSRPPSALAVIREAKRAFAQTPPFEATLRFDFNPDDSNRDVLVPRGATGTLLVSYGGPARFRTEIVAEQPRLRNEARGPGSYDVFDGRRIGSFDPERKIFYSSPAPPVFRPLEFLSWHGTYPNWERICRRAGSQVLPEARIAGRDARHIRCGDFKGGFWQLWIDRQTGLLLKIVGQVGGGDLFLESLGPGTSAKGGFEVEQLRYNPSFPAGTFNVVAPSGALDFQGRLQAAAARVPPFRAVVSGRFNGRAHVDEVWWLNDESWRHKVLAGQDPSWPGGPGSFVVSAHGGSPQSYNAHENSYSGSTISSSANPIRELLPEENPRYSPAACPIVGHDRIAGRDAVRRRCSSYDVWVDRSTGILLRQKAPGYELRIRSIVYHPIFPPGTFRFVAPPGARSADQLANDPYYKTKLRPGKPAPTWHAAKLGGGTFRLSDLRGKPALLLLFPDWCGGGGGDPVCDVLKPLEQAFRVSKHSTAVVWVDFQGNPGPARKIVRHNHLTFPVVVDPKGSSLKTWKIQGYPYWLLLDSRGRVIEAHLGLQTATQLNALLSKAR